MTKLGGNLFSRGTWSLYLLTAKSIRVELSIFRGLRMEYCYLESKGVLNAKNFFPIISSDFLGQFFHLLGMGPGLWSEAILDEEFKGKF